MKEENAGPVFDMDHILDITGGDTEFLKELVELFNADCPQKLNVISRAIEDKDFKTLDEAAHSLKGASGNLGLPRLHELSLKLEKMGKSENTDGANVAFKEIEEEFKRFGEFISRPGWEEK